MDTSAEPSADTSADGRWVSYAELAAIRGIDHHSARRLTARQRWRRQKDNHGVVRVLVPLDHLKPERRARDASADMSAGMSTDASAVTPADVSADISAVIKPLEDAIATLREQLTVSNARAEQAEVRAAHAEQAAAQERGRADALRDRLATELQHAQESAAALRLTIDELKAEQGAHACNLELAEARIASLEAEAAAKIAQIQAEAEEGRRAAETRAEQAERGLSAERSRAEALRASVDELRAGQTLMADMHAQELAAAQREAQEAAEALRRAEEARQARGRWARLRAAWRGQ